MDAEYSRCVQKVFVDLYKKGLIYRGKRMVNWCPVSLTALTDEEVMKPQKGYLYHFKVEVVGGARHCFWTIATTRPETIPGDTAVAVNPKDPRYAHLIGKHVRRPLPRRKSSGVPDHRRRACGLRVRHRRAEGDARARQGGLRNRPAPQAARCVDIMNPDGTMNELAGEDFAGLDRFEARNEAVEKLRELGALVKEEPYENNVGFSERADVPIEPRLSEQWFLKYPRPPKLAKRVRDGLIRFFPSAGRRSTTIGWTTFRTGASPASSGGAIAFRCGTSKPNSPACDPSDERKRENLPMFAARLTPPARTGCKIPTCSTRGFHRGSGRLRRWLNPPGRSSIPTTDLVTAPDIIFFWVARMIMAGFEYMQANCRSATSISPASFATSRAARCRRSLGNSPDPLDLIAKYGADGLRFGLMRIAPQGQDIRFDEQQIVEGRNFCNKLWNACRFRLLQGSLDATADPSRHALSIFAKDLLAKLHSTISRVEAGYADYRFSEIAQSLYDFVWAEFCDRFIEVAKADFGDPARKPGTLATMDYTLRRILLLMHPFTPFVTEELWHGLGFGSGSVQFAGWPKAEEAPPEPRAETVFRAVTLARTLRANYRLPSSRRLRWLVETHEDWVKAEFAVLGALLNAESIEPVDGQPFGAAACPTEIGVIFLPLEGVVDAPMERKRLDGEMAKVQAEMDKVARKLASESFVRNAPQEVVLDHRRRLETWSSRLKALRGARDALVG